MRYGSGMANSPLSGPLLRDAARAVGLESPADLRRALAREGVRVKRQAVVNWLNGGGINDAFRPTLCRVLRLDAATLAAALATRPMPPRNVEAAS